MKFVNMTVFTVLLLSVTFRKIHILLKLSLCRFLSWFMLIASMHLFIQNTPIVHISTHFFPRAAQKKHHCYDKLL
jgi:hypothetical protein